jgi:hypothetical protein
MLAPAFRRALAVAGVLAVAAGPTRAAAQQPLVPGSWQLFEWLLGAGPVEGSGFSIVGSSQAVRVRITDAGVSGDAFDVLVNGAPFASTPSVVGGVNTGALTGDAAYANAALSKTEFELAPGSYVITLNVRQTAPGFAFGDGFIRADLVATEIVPEPSVVLLLAAGVGALAAARTRRRA